MAELIRALVVDDEERVRYFLEETLRRIGHVVVTAPSGEAALDLLRDTSFDVAVVDLKMPGMDGLQVIRQLMKIQPELKCVLLTGHGAAENPEQGRQCGASDCMMKPIDIDVLTQTLRDVAGRD